MAVRSQNNKASRKRTSNNLAASVVLAAAIVFAAFSVNRKSTQVEALAPSPVVVAQYDTVILPVPVEPVAAGTKVKDIRFRNVPFPSQQVPEGAITKIDEYIESQTLAALPANLPLFKANLSKNAHISNPVVESIPAGMRAMTVRVDATAAVEGWAGTGSQVDVLLVEKDRTIVVAEMVKILSAERSVAPVEGGSAPNVPATVTLLVTQEQCLAINTAIPLGRIAFALRSTNDQDRWVSTKFTSDNLRGSAAVLTDKKGVITGYVSAKTPQDRKAYALSDGKWIQTEVVPDGFFVNKDSISENSEHAKD